ncbi:MAG: hypothetical protein IKN54_08505 [Lachnospiraceae bacterium]|nr:hypothetical protein [Lachnospiraceae bacterium]
MNEKWKKTGRLFMITMAVGMITIGNRTGYKVQAKTSNDEEKTIVSVTYMNDKPVTITEGDYGYWSKTKKGEFFKYNIQTIFEEECSGANLLIKYSDNTEKVLTTKKDFVCIPCGDHIGNDYSLSGKYGTVFSDFDDDDDVILTHEIEYEGKQTFDKRWTGGHTYNIYGIYKGKKFKVPVTIEENGIKRISYTSAKKIKLKAETDGSWQDGHNGHCTLWRTDSEYPEYYEYDISPYFYKKGSKITVTYNDNSKKVYTYKNKAFRDKNGKSMPYDVSYQDKQTYKTRWKVGKTYKINLYYANKKTTFPVKIVKDNSIAGIEFVPKSGKIFKCEKNEYTDRVNAGYYLYNKGNKLIIKYKNGKKKTYKCTEGDYYWGTFKDSKGKKFSCMNIGCKTNQDKQPWEIGKTYKAKIKCMGMRTTISVKVAESKE